MPQILAIWRYPVCSLGGERLAEAVCLRDGLKGDREYLLIDATTGEVAAPETTPKWRPALALSARYEGDRLLVSSIEGDERSIGPGLDRLASDILGFECLVVAKGDRTLPGKPALPRYDISPLHVVTDLSMRTMSDALPDASVDPRRFRPNLVVSSDMSEQGWIGSSWFCGDLWGKITEPTKRCGFTMIEQPDLPEQPEILRTIIRGHQRFLGIYASVEAEGILSVGEEFSVALEVP